MPNKPLTIKAAESPANYLFGKPSGDLLDVNVWLALTYDQHTHHEKALSYWHKVQREPGHRLWFCRITMLGLIRLLCQPVVMNDDVLKLSQAWETYARFLQLRTVSLISEPADLDQTMAAMIKKDKHQRHLTDIYLYTLARCQGLRLVSFDTDFTHYEGCNASNFLLLT